MIAPTQMQELIKGLKGSKDGFGVLGEEGREYLDVIENELMKRGTLSADSLDYAKVEESCIAVLAECTHLMAIRGLVVVLAMSDRSEGLVSAFQLTRELFKSYWPDIHPQGPKQMRRRKAWAADIIMALDAGVVQAIRQNGSLPETCTKEGLKCAEACEKAEQNVALLTKSLQGEVTASAEKSKAAANNPLAEPESGQLDSKGRSDLRRDIRSISDRIERNDPAAGIAYELRSYAAWLDFQNAPTADKNNLTRQQEMPNFVVEEHTKNLKTPSRSTLSKLEDRLYMTPDWFEGHKLAHDMALALGRPTIARAIQDRVSDRIRSLPELEHLKYETKRPIVPEEIRRWALSADEPVAVPEIPQKNEELTSVEGDFLSRLQALDVELSQAVSPRSCAVIKLKMVRVVSSSGLAAQSKMMLEELVEQMADEVLKKWDSELYAEILKENSAKA